MERAPRFRPKPAKIEAPHHLPLQGSGCSGVFRIKLRCMIEDTKRSKTPNCRHRPRSNTSDTGTPGKANNALPLCRACGRCFLRESLAASLRSGSQRRVPVRTSRRTRQVVAYAIGNRDEATRCRLLRERRACPKLTAIDYSTAISGGGIAPCASACGAFCEQRAFVLRERSRCTRSASGSPFLHEYNRL